MSKNQDELKIEGAGVSPVRIKEVDDALDEYIPIKEKRCTLTPKEVAAKEKVMEKMRKNAARIGADGEGALVYRYDDDTIVRLKHGKDKLQIKTASQDGEDDDD